MRILGGLFVLSTIACGPRAEVPPQSKEIILTSLDDVCDATPGLTGRTIVDAIEPSYSVTLTQNSKTTPTPLTIGFTYTKGEIKCRTRFVGCMGCQAAPSPPWIDLVGNLSFKTADGQFDELIAVPIRFINGELTFDVTVPGDSIVGTFSTTGAVRFVGKFANGTTTDNLLVTNAIGNWK